MRGEKSPALTVNSYVSGSPPHARGKAIPPHILIYQPGITPACAGKSMSIFFHSLAGRDHPRMRGEKRFWKDVAKQYQGSPPHARGKD